jgi:zinc protease
MISFSRYTLDNGLRVLLHIDKSTPLVSSNLLYQVGSRDEDPDRTGFAHLFEHLMFSGTHRVPDYDDPIQKAGGENNAFTNSDITNYYTTLPSKNMETALWLESDRMLDLNITQVSLDVQKKVVVEEFKETCLNQPYGDAWHLLSSLAYKLHPYRWPTIGLAIDHIENAPLDEVRAFYSKFYVPNNAILVLSGHFDESKAIKLVSKWFDSLSPGEHHLPYYEQEPPQEKIRRLVIERDVPANVIFLAFKTPDRSNLLYYATDTISDILSHGESSRLYRKLVKEKKIFTSIDAYLTGTIDPGLFVIEGRISDGISFEEAEYAIWEVIHQIQKEQITTAELEKIKNKIYTNLAFSELSVLNKAINLAFYEAMNDAELINKEYDYYQNVRSDEIRKSAELIFQKTACSVLWYKSKN